MINAAGHTHTVLATRLTYHTSAAIVDSSPHEHDQRRTTAFEYRRVGKQIQIWMFYSNFQTVFNIAIIILNLWSMVKFDVCLFSDTMTVKPVSTRKLRRRPNDPLPVPEKRGKPSPDILFVCWTTAFIVILKQNTLLDIIVFPCLPFV